MKKDWLDIVVITIISVTLAIFIFAVVALIYLILSGQVSLGDIEGGIDTDSIWFWLFILK